MFGDESQIFKSIAANNSNASYNADMTQNFYSRDNTHKARFIDTMATSESNKESFINRDKKDEQQHLSVAVSYETENIMASNISDHADNLSLLTEAGETEPVITDELMALQQKSKAGGEADPNLPCEPAEATEELSEQIMTLAAQNASKSTEELSEQTMVQGGEEQDAEVVLPSGKRRGRPQGYKLPRTTKNLEDYSWEDLTSQVHTRLGAMTSDDCFVKAIEITVMARQQVEARSLHLLNAFDMYGKGLSTSAAPVAAASASSNDPPEQQWMSKFTELKQFHQLHGHFDVPTDEPSYETLANWVLQQKTLYLSLSSSQLFLLHGISFPFTITAHENVPGETIAYPQLAKSAKPPAKTKARTIQLQEERGVSTQKQIKMHRATRFSTMEAVPCLKLAPPLPPRADSSEALTQAIVPTFQQVVNFPNSKYLGNCVMCDESEFPIPSQNKGVCNNCDSAVWIFSSMGMQIKWCKGCKNFRKWLDFGEKVRNISCIKVLNKEGP